MALHTEQRLQILEQRQLALEHEQFQQQINLAIATATNLPDQIQSAQAALVFTDTALRVIDELITAHRAST